MDMQSITNAFETHVKEKRIVGAICAVRVKGKELYRKVFGYSDCAQTKPLQENAMFRLASMTKPITGVAAMICKERGLLDFSVPVSTYVPWFSHKGVGKMENGEPRFASPAREITLYDILTHSSGLGSGVVGDWQFNHMERPNTVEAFVKNYNEKYLDFVPGAVSGYSGAVAFEVLALAIQSVTGKPFGAFLQEEIFDKLGMIDTTHLPTEEQFSRVVDINSGSGVFKTEHWGLRGFASYAEGYTGGSAGLFSTLDDYLKFAQMLTNKGEYNGVRILSEESVEEMCTAKPVGEIDTTGWLREWGFSVVERTMQRYPEQPLRIGSVGWSGAYGTHFWVEPKSGVTAVLMLNKMDCGGAGSPFSAEFERLVEAELTALGV